MPPVRLTELSHGAGCACKLDPSALHTLLDELPRTADESLLVDSSLADDAAVYRLAGDLAIVSTADFFTPIVDDPFDFGRIAAANALSDVYAMGGRPVMALNLVAFSLEALGAEILGSILAGGQSVAEQAGVAIAGGHSIDDPEPKYGLSVTGLVHPGRMLRNSTARAGDELWLTKPVGGGVATTAAKRGLADAGLTERTVEVMVRLNRDDAGRALACGATAATDVTGFGLLGHLHEMALASGVGARVEASEVPAIEGVPQLLDMEEPPVAGGTRRNREWVEPNVSWDRAVPEARRWLLCDAMTSGGLLVAAPPGADAPGERIGALTDGPAGAIEVGT